MICPICGTGTWNYNTASGTRMCVNGHQTDVQGRNLPYAVTYSRAAVPVTVAPVVEPASGPSRLFAAVVVSGAALLGAGAAIAVEVFR